KPGCAAAVTLGRRIAQERPGRLADDLGRVALGGDAAGGGGRMASGLPEHCVAARTGTRQAPRLSDAKPGAVSLRALLVQSAGLAGRAEVARRARTGLRRSSFGSRDEGFGLRRSPGGDSPFVQRQSRSFASGGRNGVLTTGKPRAFDS